MMMMMDVLMRLPRHACLAETWWARPGLGLAWSQNLPMLLWQRCLAGCSQRRFCCSFRRLGLTHVPIARL